MKDWAQYCGFEFVKMGKFWPKPYKFASKQQEDRYMIGLPCMGPQSLVLVTCYLDGKKKLMAPAFATAWPNISTKDIDQQWLVSLLDSEDGLPFPPCQNPTLFIGVYPALFDGKPVNPDESTLAVIGKRTSVPLLRLK